MQNAICIQKFNWDWDGVDDEQEKNILFSPFFPTSHIPLACALAFATHFLSQQQQQCATLSSVDETRISKQTEEKKIIAQTKTGNWNALRLQPRRLSCCVQSNFGLRSTHLLDDSYVWWLEKIDGVLGEFLFEKIMLWLDASASRNLMLNKAKSNSNHRQMAPHVLYSRDGNEKLMTLTLIAFLPLVLVAFVKWKI